MTQNANVPKIPFIEGARRRNAFMDSIAFKEGSETRMQLTNVGFVSRLIVHFEVDAAINNGNAVLHEDGLFALIDQIEVRINIASANPVKLSGAMLKQANMLNRFGFAPDRAGIGKVTPQALLYSAPVASGNNKWRMSFVVPIALNDHKEAHIGVLPLYARGLRADLVIRWNKGSDIVTGNSTTVTLSNADVQVESDYFEMPDPNRVEMPAFWVVKRYSERQGVTIKGDNKIEIQQEGALLSLMHVLRLQGVRSDKITESRLYLNNNDTPYRQSLKTNRLVNREGLGIDLETGVFLHNFMNAENNIFSGSSRQTFDTGRIATFDSFVTIADDADLGNNPAVNEIETFKTVIQPLIVPQG